MNKDKGRAAIPSTEKIVEMLRQSPGYLAKHADRDRRRTALAAEFAQVTAPILAEIARTGLNVPSIDGLRTCGAHYRNAIPVLIKWLPLIDNTAIKESIVRALSVPWAKPIAAIPLIVEFRRAAGPNSDGLKWAIGNALAVVADDSVFGEISQLVREKRHGKAREMLALALSNMHDPHAVELLIELLGDEIVVCHALASLRSLKPSSAASRIEPLLNHSNPRIRTEAKKTLAKLGRE